MLITICQVKCCWFSASGILPRMSKDNHASAWQSMGELANVSLELSN